MTEKLDILRKEYKKLNDINLDLTEQPEIQQIHPSSLLAHLGLRTLGQQENPGENNIVRGIFNAETLLAYYDIGKNYYMNRQEKTGVIIDYSGTTPQRIVSVFGNYPMGGDFRTQLEPPNRNADGFPIIDIVPNDFPVNKGDMYLIVKGIDLDMESLTEGKMVITYIPIGGDIEDEVSVTMTAIAKETTSDDGTKVIALMTTLNNTENNIAKREDVRAKISEKKKGKNNHQFGKSISKDHKNALRNSVSGIS